MKMKMTTIFFITEEFNFSLSIFVVRYNRQLCKMELNEFAGKYSYDGLILYLWNYYSYNNREQRILSILIWFSI